MKLISSLMRGGQVSSLSIEPTPDESSEVAKIEVDIYEGEIDGNTPYLLEFYCYDQNEISHIKNFIDIGDWVVVNYKTLSKKNRASKRTYTVSHLQSIKKVTPEQLEHLNKQI